MEEYEQFYADDGCVASLQACAAAAAVGDPQFTGSNSTVNEICALIECDQGIAFEDTGRHVHDFAAPEKNPFPHPYYLGYLNQNHVQRALGVPINFTQRIESVANAFAYTGDFQRDDNNGGYLKDIGTLLDGGVKVALMYGDRDWMCNVRQCH